MTDDRQARGKALAERYFGPGVPDEWREVSPDLADLTEGFAFGDLWSRPGLGLRDRALVAVAVTAAIRAEPQLAWHVRGALRAGLSPEEIREAIIAVTGFAGFPASWNGLRVAEAVMAEGADVESA
jgi:4-carboxymuconolactone decarboxylase